MTTHSYNHFLKMDALLHDEKLIKEYIESGRMLKQKFDELKFGKMTRRVELEEKFKPITESVQSLKGSINPSTSSTSSSSSSFENVLLHPSPQIPTKKKLDNSFGLYVKGKSLFIGNSLVTLTRDNRLILETDQSTYKITPGLKELLLYVKPENYTVNDLQNYEQILLKTYAYKRNNDSYNEYNKASKNFKYTKIIRPFLLKNKLMKSFKEYPKYYDAAAAADDDDDSSEDTLVETEPVKGSGLRKFNTNTPVEYVHWNTIDELLERLCHLWGEVQAGNTNPSLLNEIVNIIQEFKEL